MDFRFVALLLVAVNGTVFLFQGLLPLEGLVLNSSFVLERPWTLLTHMFLHGSPTHLLGNMFALGLFGSILERLVGWKKFLLVFLVGGFVSSIGDVLFYSSTIGASGAVFGILGTVAVLKPKMGVPAFGTILPMAVAAAFWVLFDLTGFIYPDGIAHAAHLFGMAAGVALGLYLREPTQKISKQPLISEEEHKAWEKEWMHQNP